MQCIHISHVCHAWQSLFNPILKDAWDTTYSTHQDVAGTLMNMESNHSDAPRSQIVCIWGVSRPSPKSFLWSDPWNMFEMLFDVVRLGPLDRDSAVFGCPCTWSLGVEFLSSFRKKRWGSKGFTAREQMPSIVDEWNRGVTSLALVSTAWGMQAIGQ